MNRRRFCASFSALIAFDLNAYFVKALASQSELSPDYASPESYAVWSILIPLLQRDTRGYLIPSLTIVPDLPVEVMHELPLTPIERASRGNPIDVQVPSASQEKFHDAAAQFNQKSQMPVRLEPKLALPHPYRLMTPENMAEYRRLRPPVCVIDPAHPWQRDRRLERKYAKLPSPCFFSRVFFDQTNTLGLIWARAGNDGWTTFCFQKEGSEWKQRDWAASVRSIVC